MRPIRIALTKGRLEEKSIEMFEQLGYDCSEVRNKGRRLVLPLKMPILKLFWRKQQTLSLMWKTGYVTWVWWGKIPSWKTAAHFMK